MKIIELPLFIIAVSLAVIHELFSAVKARLPVILSAVRHWINLNKSPDLRFMQQLRMSKCVKCPVYYAPLKTCGSILQPNPIRLPNGNRAGCLCFLPVKTAYPEARCWASEEWDYLPKPIQKMLKNYRW